MQNDVAYVEKKYPESFQNYS